jgi:predicted NAD-dependent protein-ADP-ribosyltransferase YbiA (DUF1768 family)
MITFTKTELPYGWLGNMSAHPVTYKRKKYRTPEALFQALRFRDEAIIEKIRAEKSPFGAKLVAKGHKDKMVIEETSPEDVANMERVLKLKIKQHPELARDLKATGTRRIIEDCTARPRGNSLFWGAARQNGKWVGQNKLGELWEKIRKGL